MVLGIKKKKEVQDLLREQDTVSVRKPGELYHGGDGKLEID